MIIFISPRMLSLQQNKTIQYTIQTMEHNKQYELN